MAVPLEHSSIMDLETYADLSRYGGPGSGDFGHPGRPGLVGGSASGSGVKNKSQEEVDEDEHVPGYSNKKEISALRKIDEGKMNDLTEEEINYLQKTWPEEYGHPNEPFGIKGEIDVKDVEKKVLSGNISSLSANEKFILQTAYPDVYGNPGEKFPTNDTPIKIDNAVKNTGFSREEIESVIKKSAKSLDDLNDSDKRILQEVFPEIYGKPGNNFPSDETVKERQISKDTGHSIGEIRAAVKKIEKGLYDDISKEDMDILQKAWPDIYGKTEKEFPHNNDDLANKSLSIKTGFPEGYIQHVRARAERGDYDLLTDDEQKILQEMSPDVYGKPGSSFPSEEKIEQNKIKSEYGYSPSDVKRVESKIKKGDFKSLSSDDKKILQAQYPDVYGKTGDPFPTDEDELRSKSISITTGYSQDEIEDAISKADDREFDALSSDDKKILQSAYPDIYGKTGSEFPSPEKIKEKLIAEDTGLSSGEVKSTMKKVEKGQYENLTENDKKALQEGWPDLYGKPGEPFPSDPDELRKKVISQATGYSQRDVDDALDKAERDSYENLSEKDKEILQKGYPQIYGKPGTSFPTDEQKIKEKRIADAVGVSVTEVKSAIKKAEKGEELTASQKKILQTGWPNDYGSPGESFRYKSKAKDEDEDEDDRTLTSRDTILVDKKDNELDIGDRLQEIKDKLTAEKKEEEPEKKEEEPDKKEPVELNKDRYSGISKNLGVDTEEIDVAIAKAKKGEYDKVSAKEKQILQTGWPDVFGFPGSKLKEDAVIKFQEEFIAIDFDILDLAIFNERPQHTSPEFVDVCCNSLINFSLL